MGKHLDLRDFFATGDFLGLNQASTRDEVLSLLGPPDDVGLVSRKHKLPRIWVYGGIELTFGYYRDSPLELIHFDYPNLPPPGSAALSIDPWVIAENMTRSSLENACCEVGITFTCHAESPIPHWRTSGDVHLFFSDDAADPGLYAVSLVLRAEDI